MKKLFANGFKRWSVFMAWAIAAIIALFYDREFLLVVASHRTPFWDEAMLFFSDFGMLFGLILFAVALFEKHLTKQLVLIGLALFAGLVLAHLLKQLFVVPRPYVTWDIAPLKTVEGFSFPSLHATFIFAALPFLKGPRFRRSRWHPFAVWSIFAALVALSRVYVGVHYVSDVVVGAGLGYAVGAGLYHAEERGLSDWFLQHFKDKFEVRRQVMHALLGVWIIFLWEIGLLTPMLMLWILVGGSLVSITSLYVNLPGVARVLDYFERPHHRRILPGRGIIFLVLGALLAFVFFPLHIASGAVAVMAIGDSTSHLFGRYLGKVRLPYNSKKTVEGVLVGVGAATLAASFFVPLHVAFVASAVALFVETWDLKFGMIELDDNVLVPLVAGAVMVLM